MNGVLPTDGLTTSCTGARPSLLARQSGSAREIAWRQLEVSELDARIAELPSGRRRRHFLTSPFQSTATKPNQRHRG
jgi:hypothetical protein